MLSESFSPTSLCRLDPIFQLNGMVRSRVLVADEACASPFIVITTETSETSENNPLDPSGGVTNVKEEDFDEKEMLQSLMADTGDVQASPSSFMDRLAIELHTIALDQKGRSPGAVRQLCDPPYSNGRCYTSRNQRSPRACQSRLWKEQALRYARRESKRNVQPTRPQEVGSCMRRTVVPVHKPGMAATQSPGSGRSWPYSGRRSIWRERTL